MLIIGVVGWSDSGKTMLITKIIPLLVPAPSTVVTVKHKTDKFERPMGSFPSAYGPLASLRTRSAPVSHHVRDSAVTSKAWNGETVTLSRASLGATSAMLA